MSSLISKRRTRREAHSVQEPVRPNPQLQVVKKVRDLRVQKLEAEMVHARQQCHASRAAMRAARVRVEQAQVAADNHWQEALAAFQSMAINSKEFVARKFGHQQLKLQIAIARNEARDAVSKAKADRASLSQIRKELQQQRVQVEKLVMLRDFQVAELERIVGLN